MNCINKISTRSMRLKEFPKEDPPHPLSLLHSIVIMVHKPIFYNHYFEETIELTLPKRKGLYVRMAESHFTMVTKTKMRFYLTENVYIEHCEPFGFSKKTFLKVRTIHKLHEISKALPQMKKGVS